MCCRGRKSRRGFGPGRGDFGPGFGTHCGGANRGFASSPEGAYQQRPGPRGLFGMLAAKRAAKQASREAFHGYQDLPDTKQTNGYVNQREFEEARKPQQKDRDFQWEDEKRGFQGYGFQEQKIEVQQKIGVEDKKPQNSGGRTERPEILNVSPPRYSMVMRE